MFRQVSPPPVTGLDLVRGLEGTQSLSWSWEQVLHLSLLAAGRAPVSSNSRKSGDQLVGACS